MNKTQRKVLAFISDFIKINGYSPIQQQIASANNMSRNLVAAAVVELMKAGHLVKVDRHTVAVPDLPPPGPRPANPYAKAPAERTKRKCLSCGTDFQSEWMGNRVCDSCKGTNLWRASQSNDYGLSGLRSARV